MNQTSSKRETEGGGQRTMASILADAIRDDIISGALPPESKLRLKELAERYDAGVIPLREALSRLAMTGFVRAEDQRGFRVTGISRDELADITQTRKRIETDALANAIVNGDVEWEGRVLLTFHRLSKHSMTGAGQVINREWEEAHDAFHDALLSGCTSKWLIHFARILRDQTSRYRHLSVRTDCGEKRDVETEHKALVDAVLARDSATACRLLSEHFDTTTRLVLASDSAARSHKSTLKSAPKRTAKGAAT
jgi:DNA-binding GntR family transcriptional regulator